MLDLKTAKADEQLLREALAEAGVATWKGRSCCCPFHDDKHPSAGIFNKDGAWFFKCHVCGEAGDVFDIRAKAKGITVEEVIRDWPDAQAPAHRPPPQEPPKPAMTIDEIKAKAGGRFDRMHAYVNPETKQTDMLIFRLTDARGKTFWQARPNGSPGKFIMGAPAKPWPIYNRTMLARYPQARVLVVEGEKCVEALHLPKFGCQAHVAGIVATTSPGGANNPGNADWTPLAGRQVWIWPDKDENGLKYGRAVMEILQGLGCEVRWIDPETLTLSAKGDVADFLAAMEGVTEADRRAGVWDVLEDAEGTSGSDLLAKRFADMRDGKWVNIPWPWVSITQGAKAMLPGKVTIVCGPPGGTKSFWVLQAVLHWLEAGHKAVIYELEDNIEDHLNRALVQLAGDSNLMDERWVKGNYALAEEARKEYGDKLARLGRAMTVLSSDMVQLDELAAWVEAQCKAGAEIIVIDPISLADAGKDRYVADQRFILRVKQSIRATGARLILVTHPKQGKGGAMGMDGMAGGAAYQRFPHTVLWVEPLKKPEDRNVSLWTQAGQIASIRTVNRKVCIFKARNGGGSGREIGMWFEPQSFAFTDMGVLQD